MQIDSSIDAKIIFTANEKPFIEVIDAICDMADLRYSIQSDILKIVKDTPYSKNYDVQFLNLSRDSENKIAIATDVNGVKQTDDDKKITVNSDSSITVKAKSDFWNELNDGLKIILGDNKYSINKQAGIITVSANSKVHNDVANYLQEIKEVNTSQVLIEAKIIEVILKNEYKRGINWNLILDNINVTSNIMNIDSTSKFVEISHKASDVEKIVKALEEFGSIRTISNPRITAMNNQAAVLKIAQNHVYFKINYDKSYANRDAGRDDINLSSDISTIPIGLVMFVQPSIDLKTRSISLFLRPTITKLTDTVPDPAVDLAFKAISNNSNSNYVSSKVPVTEVREVASVLKINDGEVAILGGFMEVLSSKNKRGLPIFRDFPILGESVSSAESKDKIVELVILIKVKILNSGYNMQPAADIRLQRFVPDPRPF